MSLWRAELCLTSPKQPAASNTHPFHTPQKKKSTQLKKLVLWPTHESKFTSW